MNQKNNFFQSPSAITSILILTSIVSEFVGTLTLNSSLAFNQDDLGFEIKTLNKQVENSHEDIRDKLNILQTQVNQSINSVELQIDNSTNNIENNTEKEIKELKEDLQELAQKLSEIKTVQQSAIDRQIIQDIDRKLEKVEKKQAEQE